MSKAYDEWFNTRMDINEEWQVTLEKAWNAGYDQFFKDNPQAIINEVIGNPRRSIDRRAELLEMASRLAVASPFDEKRHASDPRTIDDQLRGWATNRVIMADAIIAEVDRVSEVKP